jgi:DNA-binding winged helix-turn-helix (wHTH) protein
MKYVFGDFIIEPQRRSLARRSGEAIMIGDKAFDALLHLLRQPGQVIDRASLEAALWPQGAATGNNLSQAIRALRLALSDTAPPYRYVATVQRRGYQFVADVLVCAPCERLAAPIEEPQREAPRSRSAWLRSIYPLVTLAWPVAIVLIVSPFDSPPSALKAAVPDRIVLTEASAWPLPPLVACQQEVSGSMSQRCKALLAASKERARWWRLGMQRT